VHECLLPGDFASIVFQTHYNTFFLFYIVCEVFHGYFFHASVTFSTWMLPALLLPLCAQEQPPQKRACKG